MAVEFKKTDLGALTDIVNLTPELVLCAALLRKARKANVRYPIESYRPMVDALLGKKKSISLSGHRFTAAYIKRYINKELLPIADRAELASAIYLGLCRCRADEMWAASAPTYAAGLLKEQAETLAASGGTDA